jgi:uncharacterized protein YndB with AHSA1/START domain
MNKTLQFSTKIKAPRARVWDTMLDAATYAEWTSAFCAGSHYVGSWQQGEQIRFLDPNGSGMLGEIAENRRHEFISIRMLGEINAGVEDTTSDKVRAWAPAYENYTFRDQDGGTELQVSVDIAPEYEQMMQDAYPRALARLKEICEAGQASRAGLA